MASLARFLLADQCYHTISPTHDRVPVFADDGAASVVLKALEGISVEKAYVLAYAIMPDHLHAILVPREGFSLPQVMQSLKGYSSRIINEQRHRRGSIWQPSYFDRVIRTEQHLADAVHYVEHNPVKDGLARRPEEYHYSSAHPSARTDLEAWLGGAPQRLESLGYDSGRRPIGLTLENRC